MRERGKFPSLVQLNGSEALRPMLRVGQLETSAGLRGTRMQARALFAKRKPIKGLALVGLDLDAVSLCFVLHEAFSSLA